MSEFYVKLLCYTICKFLTGYLACARCSTSGVCLNIDPISVSGTSVRPLQVPTTRRCPNCSGAGKVHNQMTHLTLLQLIAVD